ncbi:hypothetical protein HG530_008298 [Fusarium avenaceum]|nr:hypothetical protein HG530_008298 [Fusarium avenaceum]
MSISSSIGVLIIRSSTIGKDLAPDSVKHDGISTHGIRSNTTLGLSLSSSLDISVLLVRIVPIHSGTRTSLENRSALPTKQPSMVIGAKQALYIVGEHLLHISFVQQRPGLLFRVVHFAVLEGLTAAPGATDCEDLACGCGGRGMVASGDFHVRARNPALLNWIKKTGSLGAVTACDDKLAISVERNARTEHVVVCLGDFSL